jgi:hypothetical protein
MTHILLEFIRRTACDARNLFPPTASPKSEISATKFGSSMIPTDMPIGPPDPLPYPSEDPTGKSYELEFVVVCARRFVKLNIVIYCRSLVLWNRY